MLKPRLFPAALALLAAAPATAQYSSGLLNGRVISPFALTIHGVVNVTCTSGDDVVDVVYGPLGSITVSRGSQSRSYPLSSVQGVRAHGGDGNDTIRNHTSVPSDFDGGNGNDQLQGGSGPDVLRGGSGADTIRGGSGRDEIYGGYGNDWVYGDAGQDRIVTVGGGADLVFGGYQWDDIWCDATDHLADVSSNEILLGYAHVITAFDPLDRPGSTFQPSLDPNGVNLPEPQPLSRHSVLAMNQGHAPLFGSAGPVPDDVNQGGVGDCYFMAMLSAIAAERPDEIRNMVTELGDGTYAVRFYRHGYPRYIRVDADLWMLFPSGEYAYAAPGSSGAIWAPIVEKAFAFFRKEEGTYGSIAGGNTGWGPTAPMLGATSTFWSLPATPDKAAILAWVQAGRPNGTMTQTLNAQARDLMEWVDQQLQNDAPVYTGAIGDLRHYTALESDNYRRDQHQYHVYQVNRDLLGRPSSLVLRDPHGVLRTLTDPARIVFHVGNANRLDF